MRLLTSALLATLTLSPAITAQTPCYAENDVAAFKDNTSTGGPNLLIGVQFVAPTALTVRRIEVFTGEQTGTNSVAIWSHDAAQNQPQSALSTGTWSMSSTNSWQGADLPSSVTLAAGATYWMVWGPQNGSQSSITPDQPMPGQVYRGSFDGGATWSGPFQSTMIHWKFRLYCSCGGFYQPYGTSCPSSGAPTLTGNGCPSPGGVADVLLAGGPAGAPVVLFLGSNTNALPISPACNLQNLPVFNSVMFNLSPAGDAALIGPVPPSTPAIDFYLQALVGDPTATPGFTSTAPLQVHIQ